MCDIFLEYKEREREKVLTIFPVELVNATVPMFFFLSMNVRASVLIINIITEEFNCIFCK